MGHSSQSVGKPRTPGWGLIAKAPSLRKDRNKGTQRTRKLSTGNALWSWRNVQERFVRSRRGTEGAKPYTMKVVRTVFNGGHEETYGNATRLVPTQRVLRCEHGRPQEGCQGRWKEEGESRMKCRCRPEESDGA